MIITKENHEGFISTKFPELSVARSTLYIVSTPIGNLEDISFRALHVLKNVNLIACEDTRKTGILLKHYGIRNELTSYFSHNENVKIEYIIERLQNGDSVAVVSDAGTPCISDPGGILVNECVRQGINVISIPGASSVIHSLVLSGFKIKKFYFQGFLPQKKGREKTFTELSKIKALLVIFESPFRVMRTLEDIHKFLGNKEIAICRELTKMFEEEIRGKVKDFVGENTNKDGKNKFKTKGEFVIVINNL
ncbi:MAG TPA: 16S rRNA (cytidine(1402)-2'-O)-methyltransferase [Ignavibacteria bacterium]|nr:16S rRNA (cytidine(1402)-2'-O)-methyltransferase [Ignavibacteria bacterium]